MRFVGSARRVLTIACVAAISALAGSSITAAANVPLTPVSSDPFTNTTSQHHTQVEPDTFSFGTTIVSAFQSGRFTNGGASDISFATSTDSGTNWAHGSLPGISKVDGTATASSNPYDRVSDPAVAYDAKNKVWMIATLPLVGTSSVTGAAVAVSRSTDGGSTWGNPVTVAAASNSVFGSTPNLDKDWIACDDNSLSSFYGHCYAEFDNNGQGDLIYMSTSSDGGLTWSTPVTTADNAHGLGGQPVVQPGGTVIVPAANGNETAIISFVSTDGGSSWSNSTVVAASPTHRVAGNLRTGPLPTAEVDAAGTVYVAWQDCRFERGCRANDIVMSTSADGVSWSLVTRIPADASGTGVDHFIPGLAVDKGTSGNSAHLGLTYYFYPQARCRTSTCQLDVGFVSSSDGGSTWGTSSQLAGPMSLTWLASTTQGFMVGDYISTSFASGTAHTVFAVANAPTGGVFDEAMYSPSSGLAAASSGHTVTSAGDNAVPDAASDHTPPESPTAR
jgi:hypothetical protein